MAQLCSRCPQRPKAELQGGGAAVVAASETLPSVGGLRALPWKSSLAGSSVNTRFRLGFLQKANV